ncbi:hypothetical protein ACFLXY_02885 [Chloroflexota bacterium]
MERGYFEKRMASGQSFLVNGEVGYDSGLKTREGKAVIAIILMNYRISKEA